MSRQVEPSDTVSPWRAAKPRRPLKDFPGTPTPGAQSPHYQEPSPPNSSNKESTRLESGLRTTPPGRSDVRAELEAQGASPVFPEESVKRSKVQANVSSSDSYTKLRSSRTLKKRGEARSDSEDGDEEQPAARCQFVGNSSSHSRSSSALERSRKGLVGPPAATGGPSTKAGGLGGSLFWLALLAGAALLWSGIYLQGQPAPDLAGESHSAAHWREMRTLVREEIRGLKLQFPNQTSSGFWTIVSAAMKAPMHSLPDYPGVLLLLSSPSSRPTANCLASRLAALSSRVLGRPALPRPPPSSLIIQCGALPPQPATAKEELTVLLHSALSSGGAVALLDLELLHPDPALTLHAFTDNSNAPYKQAVLVATLEVPPSKDCKNLEQRAERALTQSWGSLGADKLAALLSRVVVFQAMEVWRHLEREVDGVKLKRAVAALLHSPGSREHDRQQVISAVLSLLQGASLPPTLLMPKLEQLSHLVWERLNTGHWAEVWEGWRSSYGLLCAARALCTAHLVLGRGGGGGEVALQCSVHCALLREVVRLCDLGLLLGGPVMGGLLEGLAQYITECLGKTQQEGEEDQLQEPEVEEVPAKLPRRIEEPGRELGWKLSPLVAALAPLPRLPCPSLTTFLTSCLLPGRPHLLEHCMQDWPAMQPRTRWSKQRLLDLAGPRTVPVELGRVYTEDSWTQRLMTVEEFVKGHMEREGGWEQSGSAVGAGWAEPAGVVGYLAQHQLLYQVPRLRADIQVPDYCYTGESEDEPDTNVWIGPRGTVSPAHTDPKHNVLCQVVGTKYVALFLPSQNECMYPSEAAMMGNTSRLDLDNIDLEEFPKVAELRGYETLLRPGEMLYIPPKVWHYVRSLEESFSVSFWWQ